MVAIRGEVRQGGHGPWLAASPDCQYKLITRGVEWPNWIYLTYPSNESPRQEDHANFAVDWTALHHSQETVRRTGFNPDTDRIIKTYIGLFVTYPDLIDRVNPITPMRPRLGFGPVGMDAPAQLLIKSVKDVVVIHAPAGAILK
jgi:hypothetical protein